jgi:glycosyltransferase involved in cell wall biosynthesis
MKRALFVQSTLQPHGGGYAVAAWMLEALRPEFDVTLLTWRPPDFDAINAHFGTSLRLPDFRVICPRLPARCLVEAIPDTSTLQKFSYLLRIAKRLAPSHDVALTAEMEADFGQPGIQYVHFPYMGPSSLRLANSLDMPMADKIFAMAAGRIRPWMLLGDFSFDRMRKNLALVNSDWTGQCYQTAYGPAAVTLYPPAAGVFPRVPFEERENGFVCVGRFHPGKRQDWVIETLARVHAVFPDIRLHLIGAAGDFPGEQEFYPRLAALARAHSSWVRLHERISRQQLAEFLSRQRYGIHAMVDEHFGMGIAEMVLAGCIPFVHNSGGQVEIVGNDPALTYTTAGDAVDRILTVLRDSRLQSDLRHKLEQRAALFTPKAFCTGLREAVRRFLAGESVESTGARLSRVCI